MNRLALLVASTAVVLGACGGGDTGGGGDRLEVIANFYPLAEAASRVGGDRVRVENLTPPGVEPHDIELTSQQVDRLEDADLVLYLGRGFQPAVAKVAARRDGSSVDVFDGLDLDEAGRDDPHFWLDPQLMAQAVDAVTEALTDASPRHAPAFEANAAQYKAELRALDGEFERGLADCDRREIVTSHAAFFHLADRYGLTQLAIAGLSPEVEPDAKRLATLTDEIEAKGITTVFFEELVSPRAAETLAREAGVKTAVLNPIEGLAEEQLDAGKDYAAVMRDNLAALRTALGCR
jgi:zinc transport system substrate-binding protein